MPVAIAYGAGAETIDSGIVVPGLNKDGAVIVLYNYITSTSKIGEVESPVKKDGSLTAGCDGAGRFHPEHDCTDRRVEVRIGGQSNLISHSSTELEHAIAGPCAIGAGGHPSGRVGSKWPINTTVRRADWLRVSHDSGSAG